MRRKIFLLLIILINSFTSQSQALRSVYIDFGPDDQVNGNRTANPDVNGHFWNNAINHTSTAASLPLYDKKNAPTPISLNIVGGFNANGIQNGGLLAPEPSLLGSEYAIATATQDYFYVESGATGKLRFTGLDPAKRYVFHLFGSRQAAENRITQYTFTGLNKSIVTLKTTGNGIGANNYPGNNNKLAISDTTYVDGSGTIVLDVIKTEGQFAYLNFMKVEEFNAAPNKRLVLENSGFELRNISSWNLDPQNNVSVDVVSTRSHTGTYAARMKGNSVSLEQQITYLGGQHYKLTGYYFQDKMKILQNGQSAALNLSYYNKDGKLLGNSSSPLITNISPLNIWTKLEAFGPVPALTVAIKAKVIWNNIIAGSTESEVLFDDLSLVSYEPLNDLKIVYFGSSVPFGQGATNNIGYTSLYSNILQERNNKQIGAAWQTSNISVPGDNTEKVLNRWDTDFRPQKAKYVVYALALGNEGIHEFGQPRFDQFKTNLQKLIKQARDLGSVPIITNSYTRNDYNAADYAYIQQMNLLIHSWDVPSVNLLGVVDNGAGRWASGFWVDALHPNDAGHSEMAYAIVPSLFDALAENKPLPKNVTGSYIKLASSTSQNSQSLEFIPENIVHSFTNAVAFKSSKAQTLVKIKDAEGGVGIISTDATGKIKYLSPKTGSVLSAINVHDGKWHKISLTHYHARGETILYVDSVKAGVLAEKLIPTRINLSENREPQHAFFRNWTFHRAGMTQEEIYRSVADSVLKSSLELYAPLDGKLKSVTDSLVNLAQSLNTISIVSSPLGIKSDKQEDNSLILYPNPAKGEITISTSKNIEGSQVFIYDLTGREVFIGKVKTNQINIASLNPGVYSLILQYRGKAFHTKLLVQNY